MKRKTLALVRGCGELALKIPSPSSATLKSVPRELQPGNVGKGAEIVGGAGVGGGQMASVDHSHQHHIKQR